MIPRCTRCLMPGSYPGITFDSKGLCNFCLSYQDVPLLGEEVFLEKISSKRGGKYDCVVGISGGKDSCYAAYVAKKKFGLRVLAVSYDFPFMVDLARQNTKSVCEQLEIKLIIVKSQNNLEVDLLRNHLISLAATGTTWGQCMFCHYGIEAILYQIATSEQVPFILSGITPYETWWDPGSRLGILAKRLQRLSLPEKFLFGVYQSRAYWGLVDQRRQFPLPENNCFNVYQHAQYPATGPEILPIYGYIQWDQEMIEKTLQEETGWRKPVQALTWRYDCILEPLLNYTFVKDLGISSTGLYLCGLIRSGAIKREEAVELLEENENQAHLEESMRRVLDFLEIPPTYQEKYLRYGYA